MARSASSTDRQYYVKDHLGSIRGTINEGGSVDHQSDYYPFGLEMPSRVWTTDPPRERYTGHEIEELGSNTTWYYAGARMYDPVVARWMTVDPLADKNVSDAPYVYVVNNPLIFLDPTGKDSTIYIREQPDAILTEAQRNTLVGQVQKVFADNDIAMKVVYLAVPTDDEGNPMPSRVAMMPRLDPTDVLTELYSEATIAQRTNQEPSRTQSRIEGLTDIGSGRAGVNAGILHSGRGSAIALANNAVHESLHAMGSVHNREPFNMMNERREIADVEKRRQYIIRSDREVINMFLGRK